MRKRWKRKSGYITPKLTISYKDVPLEDLFINPYYSDWDDWRDGQRDLSRYDKSTFRRDWKCKKPQGFVKLENLQFEYHTKQAIPYPANRTTIPYLEIQG